MRNGLTFIQEKVKLAELFCCEVSHAGQSRILTNFNGSFDAVDTLAHELGHAYHGTQTCDHRILNRDYPMQVAETASTFNETHITCLAIAKPQEKRSWHCWIISLMNTTQVICDIYSRFLFEDSVFNACKTDS